MPISTDLWLTCAAPIHRYPPLQHLPDTRQDLAPPPIPSHLRDTQNETSMLRSTGPDIRLRALGNCIFDIHLYSDPSILGYQHSRTLFPDTDILVHDIESEYSDRCGNFYLAIANTTQAAIAVETKTDPHVHFHNWVLVCVAIISLILYANSSRSVCIISILRLHTPKVAVETSDPTWDDEAAATWSILELNMGIVCSCLPTLRPLVTRILPQFIAVTTATPTNRTEVPAGSKVHLNANVSRDKFMSEDSER